MPSIIDVRERINLNRIKIRAIQRQIERPNDVLQGETIGVNNEEVLVATPEKNLNRHTF